MDGCRKQRNFGMRGQRAQRCKAHALAGMVCPTRASHRLAAAWVPLRRGGTQRARAPAGERRHADLRRGRLPDAVLLWLPGAARKAMPGARAQRHGERVRRARRGLSSATRCSRASREHAVACGPGRREEQEVRGRVAVTRWRGSVSQAVGRTLCRERCAPARRGCCKPWISAGEQL